jgi:hypothetical protein
MGNLVFEVVPDRTNDGPRAIARIQAVGAEFRGAIKALIEEAVSEGVRVAKAEAPSGRDSRHEIRIVDAITSTPVVYHPGGAGGGGFYEATIEASALVAPHLRWVFEGTGLHDPQGAHLIRPSHGNVMGIQKEGEPTSYVRWTRGQARQQRWWEEAEQATDTVLAAGVRSLGL